jgi:hypothetical protein
MGMMIENSSLNKELTVQDRVRLKLNEFGQRTVPITIDELAASLRLPNNSVYQAINRLRIYGEVDVEKEQLSNGKEKIVGIKINKLEPSTRTYRRAVDRAHRSGPVKRIIPEHHVELNVSSVETVNGIPLLTETTDYLNKKLAVEHMKQQALEAGLDASVIAFEPNPLGEEAIVLLKMYTELQEEVNNLKETNRGLGFDLEAERRNAEYYKNKVTEETQQELRRMAVPN